MDAKERATFRAGIVSEIEAVKAEIPRLKEQMKPVAPDDAIGRLSRMDTIVNQSVVEKQLSNMKLRLMKLEVALKRVDEDPDFGICIDCGDPIAPARLKAMPETELCVECAE